MIIRTVRLQHFGIFYGEQELELDRGLSVIHGENGRGKTTLLNAIKWALFGEYEDRQGRSVPPDVILNRDARRQGDRRFGVDIELEDGTSNVFVRRSATLGPANVTPGTSRKLLVEVDGRELPERDAERELSRILDRRLARFALFDGEQLQDYEALLFDDRPDARLIKQSIDQILGVRALERTLEDLAAVQEDFEQEIARVARRERKAGRLGDAVDELEAEVATHVEAIDQLRAEQERLHSGIREQDAYLQRYEQAMANLKTVEALESALQQLQLRRADLKEAAAEHMRVAPYDVLARLVRAGRQSDRDPIAELQAAVLGSAAHASLASGLCALCNRPFVDHELDEFRDLIDSRYSNGHASVSQERVLRALRIVALQDTGRFNNLLLVQRALDEVSAETRERERELRALRQAIDSLPETEIRDAQARRDELQRRLGAVLDRWTTAREELTAATARLRKLQDQLAATVDLDASTAIRRKLRVVSELQILYTMVMDRYRDRLRNRVQKDATAAFRQLVHDPDLRELRINESYGLEILDGRGDPIPQRSAGQEQVVALSLIAALHQNAYRSIPLMMDTPFGRLDPLHRRNILDFFAGQAEQVILLVHGGEVRQEDLASVRDRISAEFELQRVEPDVTRIKAVSLA